MKFLLKHISEAVLSYFYLINELNQYSIFTEASVLLLE